MVKILAGSGLPASPYGTRSEEPKSIIIINPTHVLKTPVRKCSKCECQRHNLFYGDNITQVQEVLYGTLREEEGVVEQIGKSSSFYSS